MFLFINNTITSTLIIMDTKSSVMKSKISSIHADDFVTDTTISAKLRRLKIQEEILTASANKNMLKGEAEENMYYCSAGNQDLRNYLSNIKKSYSEIKQLYHDIKIITKDRENLKNTDIDDVKKDLLDLEEKITSLKKFFRKEISVLKVAEKELKKQIHEQPEETKIKYQSKVLSKPFNEVIPSPVRALIKSPFKCIEVQQFQEFMKNSKRFGGWDEYNHNTFVHIWNKHYKQDEIVDELSKENRIYVKFRDEVSQKIFGIKSEDVFSHTQWYLQYIHLKTRQETALNKWRENKNKIRYPKRNATREENNTDKINNRRLCKKDVSPNLIKCEKQHDSGNFYKIKQKDREIEELFNELELSDSNSEVQCESFEQMSENVRRLRNIHEGKGKQVVLSHLLKPTKQWENRSQKTINAECRGYMNIEKVEKLKIPKWRLVVN